MDNGLWSDCLGCNDKCCGMKNNIVFPIFVTDKEISKIGEVSGLGKNNLKIKFNELKSCLFFNIQKECDIYEKRPVDCRLFPFDIHKISGKFYWIVWKNFCIISNKSDKERYLSFFEKSIIPGFKQHLEDYTSFRCEELVKNHEFEVLREMKI